jgi:D-ribose pyranase
MKKSGTLNAQLSRVIAAMGHSDRIVICDCGLPIPHGAEVVDLALAKNIPRFIETLSVVLEELQVESAVIASEMSRSSPRIHQELVRLLGSISVSAVPHEEFKRLTSTNGNIAFVRTGEATPYANVILVAGVAFD